MNEAEIFSNLWMCTWEETMEHLKIDHIKNQLFDAIESKHDRLIAIRRYLHQHPEVSFHEKETAAYIAHFYQALDCHLETNVGDGYGIVVTIDSGKPGKTLALRADFDALPIQEETGLDYASINPGISHACGHDGHTAFMMILAETLIELKDQWQGTIKIIHQPAEEIPPGGAIGMIKAGVLEGVEAIFGVHHWVSLPFGTVAYSSGPVMSGRSSFKLTIKGKGGHGAAPHLANDANVAASFFMNVVQTIISRRVDPLEAATLTVGNMEGSGLFNVIKDQVLLEGDVRFNSQATCQVIEEQFKNMVQGLALMFDVETELTYENDYPYVYNDDLLTDFVHQSIQSAALSEIQHIDSHFRVMASEDFAYYTQEIPACYFFLGQMPDNGIYYPHHNPKFEINEKVLALSAKLMGNLAIDYLCQ